MRSRSLPCFSCKRQDRFFSPRVPPHHLPRTFRVRRHSRIFSWKTKSRPKCPCRVCARRNNNFPSRDFFRKDIFAPRQKAMRGFSKKFFRSEFRTACSRRAKNRPRKLCLFHKSKIRCRHFVFHKKVFRSRAGFSRARNFSK